MAAKPTRTIKNPFISSSPPSPSSPYFFPFSPLSHSLLFFSPKKPLHHHRDHLFLLLLSFLLLSFTLSGISFLLSPRDPSLPPSNTRIFPVSLSVTDTYTGLGLFMPLPAKGHLGNLTEEEEVFWRQPEGGGYRACLDFSVEYRRRSVRVSREKRRFLVVVASGGLNQQRNQIVDAVVIARILEAALVVPVLQVNRIWEDESEFSDIFDVEHFKRTLRADVRVVSSLPSTHLMPSQTVDNQIPRDISPFWIRARYLRKLNEEGVLVLKGLDSKLSRNLPPDLQKLRCKVAFHALRFTAPIESLGDKLARRMWVEGPYIALHLRLEKDVWVRTGCLTGLGPMYDKVIAETRATQPEYLTGRLNMSHTQRRLAGLCPLNAFEMARLLKALGAPKSAPVYIAGGEPFGGPVALQALMSEFPNLVTKETLARNRELSPYANKSSALAAIDYIVSLSSDVFVPSHGGNMGRAMQGHRAYVGHRKFVKPNKRAISRLMDDSSISDAEFGRIIRKLHVKSQGQPEPRSHKRDRDVLAYPVPECMCKSNRKRQRSSIL